MLLKSYNVTVLSCFSTFILRYIDTWTTSACFSRVLVSIGSVRAQDT